MIVVQDCGVKASGGGYEPSCLPGAAGPVTPYRKSMLIHMVAPAATAEWAVGSPVPDTRIEMLIACCFDAMRRKLSGATRHYGAFSYWLSSRAGFGFA